MIASLKGILSAVESDSIIVDCSGVGYNVLVSTATLFNLPAVGELLFLFIEHVYKTDVNVLVGFLDAEEKKSFKKLVSVPGVGTKMALSILSVLPQNDLASAISQDNIALLTKAPGVGKKIAQRIIIELKSKCVPVEAGHGDAFLALLGLGYSRDVALALINKVRQDNQNSSTADILKAALSAAQKQ